MNKMTKILNYFKLSSIVFIGTGFAMVLAFTMIVSVPQVKAAEYPNILVGNNMTVGSTGQDVVVLQGLMSEMGYLNVPTGIAFGYYGSLTKDAVARYQTSNYVTPAVGYFGPVTKISMQNDFSNHGWLPLLGWQ
jgi:hypothetical protein